MDRRPIKYAGIGSRKISSKIIMKMINLGEFFAKQNFILRSGAAVGSDGSFEVGSSYVDGSKKEIWLPFPGYNERSYEGYFYPKECHFELAKKYHPKFDSISTIAKQLHARNMGQILGVKLQDPVDFVICWTPDGCDSILSYSKLTGGTGTAICCASDNGIPVFNMNTLEFADAFFEFYQKLKR